MNYKIDFPEKPLAAELLQTTLRWLKSQYEMREDYDRLEHICRADEDPAVTSRATIHNTSDRTNIKYNENQELDIFLL